MKSTPPRYTQRRTHLMRGIQHFHELLIYRLGRDSAGTMRAAAWQTELYLEEHGKYPDADFIRAIQGTLEKIIQHRTQTDWSVEKAKTDLRGRVYYDQINQTYVPYKLSRELNERILQDQSDATQSERQYRDQPDGASAGDE